MTTIWEPICSKCGSSLAADVSFCPQCGTPTSSYYSNSGVSPSDPTAVSFHSSAPQHKPATDYGSPPYGVPAQNPYEPLNPYAIPLQVPPPPSPQRPGNRISMIAGVVLLVLILVGGGVGVFAFLQYSAARNAAAAAAAAAATATAQSIATATATAAEDPYPPTTGQLAFDDPLSQAYQWDNYTNASVGLTCQFSNGAYHLRESKIGSVYTCDDHAQFSNFAFEVQMTMLHGDCGGISFRIDTTSNKDYLFQVCANGFYGLYVFRDSTVPKTLVNKSSPAITTGYNQLNTIAVVANGSTLELYVNHTKINSVSDGSYSVGFLGLDAGAYSATTEVVYSNARVWTF